MPTFIYSAKDKRGTILKSTVEAADRQDAARTIIDRGLTPITVAAEKQSLQIPFLAQFNKWRKVPDMERVVFARQFSTMIGAGLPIAQALHILERQTTNDKMRGIITDVTKQVEGGQSLSKALGKYPDVFGSIFINMVHAGEVGGILDEVLDRLANQLEKEHELGAKIKGAMIYPIIIAIAMVIVFVVMMVVVIPKLTSLFTDSGITLPLPTQILVAISNAFTTFPINLIMLIVVVGLVVGFIRYKKSSGGKKMLDRIYLKLPIAGDVISKMAIARFTRILGALLSSGIAVLDALEVVSGAVGNSVFVAELTTIQKDVKNGVPIAQPLKQSKIFPPLVGQMVAVGEETGTLDKVLLKLATFYEADVDRVVNNLATILEPVMILIMGAGVGFLVVSLMLPILKISNAF